MTCSQGNSELMPIRVSATREYENGRSSSCSEEALGAQTACSGMVGSQRPMPSWARPPLEGCTRCCWSRSSNAPHGAIRECRSMHTGPNILPRGRAVPDCHSSRARTLSPLRAHTPAPSPSPPLQSLQAQPHSATGRSNQMHLDKDAPPHRGPPALERWRCSTFSYDGFRHRWQQHGSLRSYSVGNRSDAFHSGSVRLRSVPCTGLQEEADALMQGLGSALHETSSAQTATTTVDGGRPTPLAEDLCRPNAEELVLEAAIGGSRPRADTSEPRPEPLAPPAEGILETGLQWGDASEQEAADGIRALNLRGASMMCHSTFSKNAVPPPMRTQMPRRRRMKREGTEAFCNTAG